MKKKLATVLLVILVNTTFLFGQDKKEKLRMGIKAGINFASLAPGYTDNNGYQYDYKSKNGFMGGARVAIETIKGFLLLPEVSIVSKGAKRFVNNGNSTLDMSPSLTPYLELNINMLKKFSSGKGSFMVGGGPSIAAAIDKYREELGTVDYGLNVLAGYMATIGFSVELSYNKGFKKQSGNIFSNQDHNLTTSYIGINLGYLF
jgi:hypothetical protein